MKMRLALAALLLTSTSAFAADLAPQAVEPVAPVVAPVYNWTGFYAGVHAGAAIGQAKAGSVSFDSTGFLGGVHAGYNSQFDGGFVVGLEGDIDYSSIKKSRNVLATVNGDDLATRATFKNEWQGSVRARFGYAFDNILPYVTGGVAFGDTKLSVAGVGSKSETRTGWTAGAGVEYAIDQNWIVRGEARYVDLGDKSVTIGGARTKVKFNSTDLTLGASYKF